MNQNILQSAEEPVAMVGEAVHVFGPASLSNLGPGFDALGLCIAHVGDHIEAAFSDAPGVRLEYVPGPIDWTPPADVSRNTAVAAAEVVRARLMPEAGVVLRLRKGIPLGSGIGGSAASAVGGAWAVNKLFGCPLDKSDLVDAVLAGEAEASGSLHGDNVLPALFGGLVLVSSSDPTRYRRIELPGPLPVAVVMPSVEILTRQAREMLPKQVALRDAIHNAAELAFLLDAFRSGDWETVGRCVMQDRLVEPVRAALVPCYASVRRAALEAGAFGCALTGSGPAMFALAASPADAARIAEAMVDASRADGIDAKGLATEANARGVD